MGLFRDVPFQTTVGYLSLRLACGRSVHDNTISLALEGHGSMEVQGAIKLEKLVSNVKVVSCMLFIIILYDEFSTMMDSPSLTLSLCILHWKFRLIQNVLHLKSMRLASVVNSPNKYGYLVLLTEG